MFLKRKAVLTTALMLAFLSLAHAKATPSNAAPLISEHDISNEEADAVSHANVVLSNSGQLIFARDSVGVSTLITAQVLDKVNAYSSLSTPIQYGRIQTRLGGGEGEQGCDLFLNRAGRYDKASFAQFYRGRFRLHIQGNDFDFDSSAITTPLNFGHKTIVVQHQQTLKPQQAQLTLQEWLNGQLLNTVNAMAQCEAGYAASKTYTNE